MSDTADPEPFPEPEPSPIPVSNAKSEGMTRDRNTIALVVVAVLAVVAIALSSWALLRPAPGSEDGTYSDAQRAEAKSQVCTAFNTVRVGVTRNTSIQIPGGDSDAAGALGVLANARISLYVGGLYLLDRLEPATPTELQDAVRGFAILLTDIGAAATAGAQNNDPDQAKRLVDADAASTKIGQLCA